MHHTVTEANCPLSDIFSMPEMTSGLHHFEESDQPLLLNAFDVVHKNSDTLLDFLSVGYKCFLPTSSTLFRKTKKRISIYECYLKLGHNKAEALILWHAFKGTDKAIIKHGYNRA